MTEKEIQEWKKNFIEEYLDKIDNIEDMKKLVRYTKSIWPKKKGLLHVLLTPTKILTNISSYDSK